MIHPIELVDGMKLRFPLADAFDAPELSVMRLPDLSPFSRLAAFSLEPAKLVKLAVSLSATRDIGCGVGAVASTVAAAMRDDSAEDICANAANGMPDSK